MIKEGNIIPIREELEKRFRETQELDVSKLNSNEPIEIETHASRDASKYQAHEFVSLRIRSETGKRTMIMKLLISDKMSIVYKYVRPYM